MDETVDIPIVASEAPVYAHDDDAGADLRAAEALVLAPGRRETVDTGTSVAIPEGFAGFVVPRSGLAARHGLTIVNSPGLIDAGYRGRIKVTLLNTDADQEYSIAVGDRIAQLVIMPIARARFVPVRELPPSERGTAGFGSTGYAVRREETTRER